MRNPIPIWLNECNAVHHGTGHGAFYFNLIYGVLSGEIRFKSV